MRMIDADALIEDFTMDGFIPKLIEETIKRQPTAFDVDKVVDVVREDCYSMGYDESETEIIVEVVRKGGVKNE